MSVEARRLTERYRDVSPINGRQPQAERVPASRLGIKIYVSPGPVMDVTALCTERQYELQCSLAALLDWLVNNDSISRGGLIFGFYYQIIRAISQVCCEVKRGSVMCFFPLHNRAITHQCHGGIVNVWQHATLNLSLSSGNESANMPNRRVQFLNARLGRRA